MAELNTNHDAELSLLNCLARNSERLYSIVETLKGYMFSASLHETIFNTMIDLHEKGYPINSDSLKMQLMSAKKIDDAGGNDYVNLVVTYNSDDAGFDLFLKTVVDNYKSRELLKISKHLPMAIENTEDISSLLSNVKTRIEDLAEGGLKEDVHTLEQLLSVAWSDIEKRALSPGIKGITTGLKSLNSKTGGLCEGDVWVIGARPSMGKTSMILKMAKDAAQYNDAASLIISKEMNGSELIERLLSMDSGVSSSNIKFGFVTDDDKTKLKRSANVLKGLPIFIDSNFYGDINYIVSLARKYKKQKNIKLLAIDYIQLLAERGDNQTAELGRIIRALKLLANDLQICVVVASQLNRLVEMREDKHPILSDLRQSGNIEEDADVVIGLYRDEVYTKDPSNQGKLELIILKQRDGPIGNVQVNFDGSTVNVYDDSDADISLTRSV
jgi:replicative DNA helicase